jgi:hypothetical protein
MIFLLVAGIGILIAGIVAIVFGIPVKEFGFGNTLILSGVIGACTGTLILSLFVAVRQLKAAARLAVAAGESLPRSQGESRTLPAETPDEQDGGALFERDRPELGGPNSGASSSSGGGQAPWQEESTGRQRGAPPVAAPAADPAAKPRRNLLFTSSSRKERERAAARTPDPAAAEVAPEPVENQETQPHTTFEEAWPQPERSRPDPALRRGRTPPSFNAPEPAPSAADYAPETPRNEGAPRVTVLKSGVVDGMAYSLYSDGSIEAQLPEGMMRFGSIDELRAHLDQRS